MLVAKKNLNTVSRLSTGVYCVVSEGDIDSRTMPAIVAVEWTHTLNPEGNASAMWTSAPADSSCPVENYIVRTERIPVAGGAAVPADDVGFILIVV